MVSDADVTLTDNLLVLAGRGFHLFPVGFMKKVPTVAWRDKSTTDARQITAWFAADRLNVGIDCGKSGLVVLDEDKAGALDVFAADHGQVFPVTFTVGTAQGRHLYFRAPLDGPVVANATGVEGRPIDVRGTGGLVIGPESVHESGVVYDVVNDAEVAPLPDWVLDVLTGPKAEPSTGEVIPYRRRHDTLVKIACALRGRDVPIADARIEMGLAWKRCEQPPGDVFTWEAVEHLLTDVYTRYNPEPPPPEVTVLTPGLVQVVASTRFITGGSFIFDSPPDPIPIWGRGDDVLLADGESLMIAGGQGLGKTTLAQQLALGRCGIPEYDHLLGWPIVPGDRRVLYLAMDRPRQIARSFRRMVGEVMRDDLDDRLVVWPGPPMADLAQYPGELARLCREADADTVIVDSLKDAALALSADEVGAGYNRARQQAATEGIQIVELHHNRKQQQGPKTPTSVDDLYGSTWLTAGAGSVIALSGDPGDPIVTLTHLKQPNADIGRLQVSHDYASGRSTVFHAVDLLQVARSPITASEAARALYGTSKPTPAEKARARRSLDNLEKRGALRLVNPGADTLSWVVM